MALITKQEVACRRLARGLRETNLTPRIIEESQSAEMKANLSKDGKIVSSLKLPPSLMHENPRELVNLIVKSNPLIEPTMVALVFLGHMLEVIYFPPSQEFSYLKNNSKQMWAADDYFYKHNS